MLVTETSHQAAAAGAVSTPKSAAPEPGDDRYRPEATSLTVSVIVVSRRRPKALQRCLLGISQLTYTPFEVVVVADNEGLEAIAGTGILDRIKSCRFDRPNISAARNIGLAFAAGDIVAFIDDDAVPEPGWLDHLMTPFRGPGVDAAAGFVRGRNGISYQWQAATVDVLGYESGLKVSNRQPKIIQGTQGRAIKTPGTNCAFRRATLAHIGGFDPAFHFFLDETDLNLRLAAAGCRTAIVPLAEIHHGFLASDRRWTNRMPATLFDVGASTTVFLRKHAEPAQQAQRLVDLEVEQKRALMRNMIAGNCEPKDAARLLKTLRAGIVEGQNRPIEDTPKIRDASAPFLPFSSANKTTTPKILSGHWFKSRNLHARARKQVESGYTVSLFLFSWTALFHRVFFHANGYWVQTGGIFGRSNRAEKLLQMTGPKARLRRELNRIAGARYPGSQPEELEFCGENNVPT